MSRNRDNSPVKNTCPIIDKVIDFIDSLDFEMDDDMLEAFYQDCKYAKEHLEEIRKMNSELREWGNEKHNLCDEYEDTISDLERKVRELESDLDDCQKEVSDLQKELDEVSV